MDDLKYDLMEQDTQCLGHILPVEIWKIVSKKLKHHKSFNNSSPFFRSLLNSERNLTLFPKVLSVLAERFWRNGDPESLPVEEVLNCRQVCENWNTAIDEFIWKACHYSQESSAIYKVLVAEIQYGFYKKNSCVRPHLIGLNFLNYFEHSHPGGSDFKSPFILPNLLVNKPGFDDYNDEHIEAMAKYHEEISTLVERYGSKVTDFTVEFHGRWFETEDAFFLQKWLASMSNLTYLVIDDYTIRSNLEVSDLRTFLRTTPFPSLPRLEKVKVCNFPVPLFKNLIQKNSHISELDIKVDKNVYDIFTLKLPHLKIFKVEFTENLEYIPDSFNSRHMKCPVTTLSINLEMVKNFTGWKAFFGRVQVKFADSVETFSLKLPNEWKECGSIPWQSSNGLQLCLPQLIKIDLKTSAPISLDFLLQMKDNLQCIFVDAKYAFSKAKPRAKTSIVEFHGFESEDKILDSNIWTQFGKLCQIGIRRLGSLKTKYFHRKDWEQRFTKDD